MKKLSLFLLGLSSLVFSSFCSAIGGEINEVSAWVLFPEDIFVWPSDVINFDLSDVDFMDISYDDVFFSAWFWDWVECDEDYTSCWCNNSFWAVEYSVSESISVTVPNYDWVICWSFYISCTDLGIENDCYEDDINWFYEYSITQSSSGWEWSWSNPWIDSWSNPWTDIWDSILPWWSLTPVISNLAITISEFIPYVIYVWFWILGAIIWFVAIRRLINWLRNKTLTPFR